MTCPVGFRTCRGQPWKAARSRAACLERMIAIRCVFVSIVVGGGCWQASMFRCLRRGETCDVGNDSKLFLLLLISFTESPWNKGKAQGSLASSTCSTTESRRREGQRGRCVGWGRVAPDKIHFRPSILVTFCTSHTWFCGEQYFILKTGPTLPIGCSAGRTL